MTEDFESTLDKALGQLQQQVEISSVTAEFSEDADRLQPLLTTAHILDQLQPVEMPSPAAMRADREAFLGQLSAIPMAAATPKPQSRSDLSVRERLARHLTGSSRQHRWRVALARSAMILVMLLSVLGITVVSAQRSLPTSPLYPMKLTVEDLRLQLASDDFQRAQIHLSLAEIRVKEMAQMAAAERPLTAKSVTRLQYHLQTMLQLAANSSEPQLDQLLQDADSFVLAGAAALVRTRSQTAVSTHPSLDAAYQLLQQFELEAAAGRQDPNGFRWRHAAGQGGPPPAAPTADPENAGGVIDKPTEPPTDSLITPPQHGTRPAPGRGETGPVPPDNNPPATAVAPGGSDSPGSESGNGDGTTTPAQHATPVGSNREQDPTGSGANQDSPLPAHTPAANNDAGADNQPLQPLPTGASNGPESAEHSDDPDTGESGSSGDNGSGRG